MIIDYYWNVNSMWRMRNAGGADKVIIFRSLQFQLFPLVIYVNYQLEINGGPCCRLRWGQGWRYQSIETRPRPGWYGLMLKTRLRIGKCPFLGTKTRTKNSKFWFLRLKQDRNFFSSQCQDQDETETSSGQNFEFKTRPWCDFLFLFLAILRPRNESLV